ncbi:MAG TPA: glycosyltransferase family 9 protein [Thermomicrobiaceae bacterium]|nr:glycosyltransferase family 9 protein [Thermomicrobiaceae bacterium]
MTPNPWLDARNLVAMRLDNIGDVIMLGPALRAVKEASPSARLTLLASRAGATAAPLLPWVDDVMVWKPVWQDVGNRIPFDPARERALVDELTARRFDAALIFTSFSQTPHVPGYVCYLAGIPLRAGESKEFGGSTLTDELRGAPDELHQVERNLRLVEHVGFPVRDGRLAVALRPEARAAVPALLREAGIDPDAPFVLLHPGASAAARRYPAERAAKVARRLAARGWPVLVTGVAREADLVERAAAGSPGVHPLVGRTTLAEFAGLVEHAALVICGNTLPLHLADALGTPVLALYSGTDADEQWRARYTSTRLLRRETACYPCYRFDCPIGQPCLAIPPDEVVAAAEELLASAVATPRTGAAR